MLLQNIKRTDTHAFDQFYNIYAALFPLAHEREPPEAFFQILDLNENVAVQHRYGPYREVVAAVRLDEDGPVAGGHVFGVTTSPEHHAAGFPASIQGIYTFLVPSVRGQLSMAEITRYSEAVAYGTFGLEESAFPRRPLLILEVNNPLRMTDEEIADDTSSSGWHPARRYMFWKRHGFSPLDFDYVQPRLRAEAEPVRYLDLFCNATPPATIPAGLLLAHLHSFVSISVLKGTDAAGDPDYEQMAESLARRREVRLRKEDDPQTRRIAMLARQARPQRAATANTPGPAGDPA